MNIDRFLTRVFDKQEKRMLYLGDEFEFVGDSYIFLAINNGCMFVEQDRQVTHLKLRDHQDRFVPMQCSGSKTDDIKKLLYESDIIKYKNSLAIIKWDLYEGLYLEPLIYDDNYKFHSTSFEACEFIGNTWEHPKLLNLRENK